MPEGECQYSDITALAAVQKREFMAWISGGLFFRRVSNKQFFCLVGLFGCGTQFCDGTVMVCRGCSFWVLGLN